MGSTFNFQTLPKESDSNLVKAGRNHMIIKTATKQISSKNSVMLVIENTVKGHEKITVTDRYTLFDVKGEPVVFGQYKLRKLLEATDTIPEGDFTIEVIARMLIGKEYTAELVEEEYNEKTYLNVGGPDKFESIVQQTATIVPATEVNTASNESQTTAVIVEDDDI